MSDRTQGARLAGWAWIQAARLTNWAWTRFENAEFIGTWYDAAFR